MRIHVLGICGTFMGGLALLARELGRDQAWQTRQVEAFRTTAQGYLVEARP